MLLDEQLSESELFYVNGTESSDIYGNGSSFNASQDFATNLLPHPNVLLPYSVLLAIAIYLTVVGLLSTFGNILFILTVIRWRYLRNNSHMLLLLNMAVADLAISLTGYPYTTVSGYIGKWIFGPVMCQLYAFLCFTFSQVSMNTLVAVSIFRYIAICHPHMKHCLTSRTSMIALGIVWCHALFWTISPLLGWSSYTFEPTRISCSFDWNDRTLGGITYVIGTTLFCYLSHIIILVWCYRRIFQMVYRVQSKTKLRDIRFRRAGKNPTSTTLNTSTSFSDAGNRQQLEQENDNPPDSPPVLPRCQSLIVFSFTTENFTEMELHVLGMNIAMVVAFITFWTPYAIISLISAFYDKLSPFWYIFPTIFAKTSCMINPLLYGLTNSFLRKQLLLALRGFLGMTTAIENFEVMRQRQQDGLYNKEGIFVGRRTGAITYCPCEGCVASRRQIKLLIEKQKTRVSTNNSAGEAPPDKQDTEQRNLKTESGAGEGETSVERFSADVVFENCSNFEDDDTEENQSRQRQPSPLSISSSEFQQATVKAEGHFSSSNAIILNVNTLAKDVADGKRAGVLLATGEKEQNDVTNA